jgi:hypothetical protein
MRIWPDCTPEQESALNKFIAMDKAFTDKAFNEFDSYCPECGTAPCKYAEYEGDQP